MAWGHDGRDYLIVWEEVPGGGRRSAVWRADPGVGEEVPGSGFPSSRLLGAGEAGRLTADVCTITQIAAGRWPLAPPSGKPREARLRHARLRCRIVKPSRQSSPPQPATAHHSSPISRRDWRRGEDIAAALEASVARRRHFRRGDVVSVAPKLPPASGEVMLFDAGARVCFRLRAAG